MQFNLEQENNISRVKIFVTVEGVKVAWANLYLLKNSLHNEHYGFLEDLFVEEAYRKQGLGSKLLDRVIEEAKNLGCYKLIGTSRFEREAVHAFYERRGFSKWGYEFRMDLKNEDV